MGPEEPMGATAALDANQRSKMDELLAEYDDLANCMATDRDRLSRLLDKLEGPTPPTNVAEVGRDDEPGLFGYAVSLGRRMRDAEIGTSMLITRLEEIV